MALINLRKKT